MTEFEFDYVMVKNSNHYSTVKFALEILSRDLPLKWLIFKLENSEMALNSIENCIQSIECVNSLASSEFPNEKSESKSDGKLT